MAVKAGEAFLELSVHDKEFKLGLGNAVDAMRDASNAIAAIGASVAAVGAAITGMFSLAVNSFQSFGTAMANMSTRTGIAVDTLSALTYAAKQSGVAVEDLEAIIKIMQRSLSGMGKGTKQTAMALAALGINAADLAKLLPDEQLRIILSALANVRDATMRTGAAMAIFGRSGTKILTLIGQWKQLNKQAEYFQLTISPEAAAKAQRLNNEFGLMVATFEALQRAIGEAISDKLADATRAISETLVTVIKWVKANQAMVSSFSTFAKVIAGVGVAVIALSGVMPGLLPAFEGLGKIVKGLAGAGFGVMKAAISAVVGALSLLLTPMGLVVAAVLAVGGAFLYFSGLGTKVVNFFQEKFAIIGDIAGKTFSSIGDALKRGDIVAAANVLWAGLKLAWLKGTEELRVAWAGFKNDMLGIATDLVFEVQKLFEDMSAGIQKTWATLVKEAKTIGEKIGHGLSQVPDEVRSIAEIDEDIASSRKRMEESHNAFVKAQEEFNINRLMVERGAAKLSVEERKRLKDEQEQAHQATLKGYDDEKIKKQRDIESEKEAKKKAIEDSQKIADDARKTQKQKDIDAAKAAAGEAQEEFDKRRKEAAEGGGGFGEALKDPAFEGAMADVAEAAKGMTRYTFSGRLAQQVFGGGESSIPAKQLKVAVQQKDLLAMMEKKMGIVPIKIGGG